MAASTILVPLDGSDLAEVALGEAARLARALGAGVLLLQVIAPVEDVIQSGTMRIAVDEVWAAAQARALAYLRDVRARPLLTGIAVDVDVRMGNAAETILEVARARDVERIVMATHGRTGFTRWVLGSVAEKILRAADRTVVLVRASATAA